MIRRVSPLAWAPAVSAVLMIVAVYCSWAVAYVQLGRRPRPSMDDPKSIGGFATDVYSFSVWVIGILAVIWAVSLLLKLGRTASPEAKGRNGRFLDFANGFIAVGLP